MSRRTFNLVTARAPVCTSTFQAKACWPRLCFAARAASCCSATIKVRRLRISLLITGVMGGVVGYENNYFAKDFGNPDATLTGLIVSLYEVGCIVGAVIILFFGEKIGRRPALVYGGSIVVVGTIIQASSFSVAQLIFGRIFTGIGRPLFDCVLTYKEMDSIRRLWVFTSQRHAIQRAAGRSSPRKGLWRSLVR